MAQTVFVGREAELSVIRKALDSAVAGSGLATIISGEPGIGKTRLVEHCKKMAEAKGMMVLAGAASQDSAEPFQVFARALSGYTEEPLLAMTESVSFSGVFMASASGEITAKAMAGGMDPKRIASTLNAVQSFVGDSFRNAKGRIGRMTFGDITVLAEKCGRAIVFGVIEGNEHPEMANSLKALAANMALTGADHEYIVSSAAGLKFSVRKDVAGVKLSSERNRLADRTLEIIVKAIGDRPVLMVFEDMHWSDEISLFVFSYLARISPRLRLSILATARPSESPLWDGALESLVSEGSATIIPLVQMEEAIIRKLVDAAYSPNRFPDEFYAKLAKDCAGNPLFTEELVKQMAVEGGITMKGGAFALVEAHYSVPGRVEDIVLKRLDALTPAAMAAAEHLSCAGREFPATLPGALKGLRDHEAAIGELSAAGIIVAAGQTLQFRHALFRDAIYKNISGRWLANYHKELGEYYETEYAGRQGVVIYELARHFYNSNEKAKAFDYCFKAGESAEASYAAERAIEFYGWALNTLPVLKIKSVADREVELHERAGDMLTLISKFNEALASYSEAISKCQDNGQKAKLHRKKSDTYMKLGDYDATLEEIAKGEALTHDKLELVLLGHQRAYVFMRRGEFDKAIEMCQGYLDQLKGIPGTDKATAALYDTIGSSSHRKGDFNLALDYYTRCLEMSESNGDLRKMGAVLNNIGNVYGDRLQLDMSRQYYDRGMEIFKKLGDKQSMGVIIGNIGAIYHSSGEVTKALECYKKGLTIAEETGDLRMISASLGNIGVTHFTLGNFIPCIETFERAMWIWAHMGDKTSLAWGHSSVGAAHGELGEYIKARESIQKGIDIAQKSDDPWKLCAACLFMGDLLRIMAKLPEAIKSYEKSRDISTSLDSPDIIAESLTGLAETYLETGDPGKASEHSESAVRISSDAGLKVELANALRVRGLVLASLGKMLESEADFLKSQDLYKFVENPVSEAKMQYDWGRAEAGWGNPASGRKKVKKAHETFRAKGMKLWVEKCDTILGKPV